MNYKIYKKFDENNKLISVDFKIKVEINILKYITNNEFLLTFTTESNNVVKFSLPYDPNIRGIVNLIKDDEYKRLVSSLQSQLSILYSDHNIEIRLAYLLLSYIHQLENEVETLFNIPKSNRSFLDTKEIVENNITAYLIYNRSDYSFLSAEFFINYIYNKKEFVITFSSNEYLNDVFIKFNCKFREFLDEVMSHEKINNECDAMILINEMLKFDLQNIYKILDKYG